MAAAVETEAQKYIRENGLAPRAVPELDEALKEALRGPKVTQCQGWDGQGRLAPYAELKETMTQTYRLLGEECVVQGCTNKVDAPKYVMELVGGPVCMACGQKIVLQEFRGKSAKPFEPEVYAKPRQKPQQSKRVYTPFCEFATSEEHPYSWLGWTAPEEFFDRLCACAQNAFDDIEAACAN